MDQQTQKNLLDLVRRNYEEIAADFNETRKKYLWPELIKLASQVKDGDKVLDAGCGNGRLLNAFRGKKISYLGVDSSEKLIKAVNKNFQFSIFNFQSNPNFQFSNKTQSTKFILGDIFELNKLPQKDFDYVFSVAVLHHLPGKNLRIEALEQMKGKLKPGGKIIITVWNLWSQVKFRKFIFKFALLKILGKNKMDFGDILFSWKNNRGQAMSQRYYHAFTKKELKTIANKADLKIEKLYKDKYNYYLVLKN